ncbi:hypothetical protein PAXINDRAFT_96134 [Paxillus involutus ATCC 200175]|nr:hypothetical protein PAXINDRAFT_96134 [Paxillus involutus ATCC 200175]
MIHLDRSHHELDQSQKSNLILPDDHPSSHFSWDDIPHHTDNNSFFHDPLHDSLQDNILSQQPLPLDSIPDIHQDLQQPKDRPPSPQQHPLDLHDDKSSSLSPAPETSSPQPDPKNSPRPLPQAHDDPAATDKPDGDAAVDVALTPLTDLSPAPDLDDGPEDGKEEEDEELSNVSTSQEERKGSMDRGGVQAQRTVHINGTSSPSRPDSNSPVRQPSTSAALRNHPSDPFSARPNVTPSAGPSHSRTPSADFSVTPLRPPPTSGPISGHPQGDSKVLRILELNAELFKVCLEFQHRNVPVSESRFQQYATRLQSNLTWLAAAADQRHNNANLALPIMEPPTAVEFATMDRIHRLYADLSTSFAKDIARRQLMSTPHHPSPSAPSGMTNGNLKRNRLDDLPDLASKRRDIGDNKPQTHTVPSISISGAGTHTNPQGTFPAPNASNLSVSGAPQSPRVPSPAMPPPSGTPSLPFGASEASIAASTRARARDIQIQQAREQQLRQATQMQQVQQMQAARHMSPTSTSPQTPQGVGGPPAGQPNPLSALAPQAQQLMAILRDTSHPLMQHIISQIPHFTSLPLQQQMQKLQSIQHNLQQRPPQQQQNQQTATPHRNPNMTAMTPNPAIPNGALGGGGGPSPVSPLAQQLPVMSQPQQMPSQSPQNGMYPFHQGQANQGMDPRMAGSNFTPQMPGGMANSMNANQQRHLMLMQQQMRNTNGNMNAAPKMLNQQQAYAMAQHVAQAGPSQPGSSVGGSPMSSPAGDQFPALRSNSTIPGIARSARSPSDNVHSPMTPRAPSRLSQQPQMQSNDLSQAMMQYAHANMLFNPQAQNPNWPQSGQQPMQQMGMVGAQVNGYSMTPPNSAGAGGGFYNAAPSPSNQNWQQHQQGMVGSYPYGQSMGQQHAQPDLGRPPHMTGAPLPQNMSPVGDHLGAAPGEYDIFNYTG